MLGLGATQREALTTAGESLRGGFDRAAGEYAAGWHAYLDTLAPVPASAQRWRSLYELSALVLAAHEDKTFRGGFVASPSMPWAWGTGRDGAADFAHVRAAAEFLVANGPITPQERWENAGPGYSPATIAAEIAGLVCGADLARRNGQPELAGRWLQVADAWRRDVDGWTLTHTGPLASTPYYLRITLDGQPDAATPIQISDGGPLIDQRRVVDPSFLELVRLGIKGADDPAILDTLPVVDRQLAVDTPGGRFWHRFDFDGYGETRDGGPWRITDPGTGLTLGRAWPIFAGERGEYGLAAGRGAQRELDAMASTANAGLLLPEQVWDGRPPTGEGPRFALGTPTFSATPLAWSHAQFVRLALSIQAGHPVEQPAIVACRYLHVCSG